MATLSADVTPQMKKWVEKQVRNGIYKSNSEVMRGSLRELMKKENAEPTDFRDWLLKRGDKKAMEIIKYLGRKGLL